MRIIGLDLGSKTLGIAVSDLLLVISSPYKTLRFEEDNYNQAVELLGEVINQFKPSKIILGYPKHMNNDVGIRGKISEDFKTKIECKYNIPVILYDERLTTRQADNIMIKKDYRREKRSLKKDELAASLILQNYLNSLI